MNGKIWTLNLALACFACTGNEAPGKPEGYGGPAKQAASRPEAKAEKKAPEDPRGISLSDPMPMAEREMTSVEGKSHTLASAKGEKGTLVIFTCNHCPWVQAWQERTVALANEFFAQGIGVIAINSNDPADYPEDGMDGMKARSEKLGMNYPYVVDATSDVARAFGADKTPEFFLFDAEGKLAYHGALDDNAKKPDQVTRNYLREALEAVTAGKPVPVAETKALGCGIKFRPST